jgi:hypothetical protein
MSSAKYSNESAFFTAVVQATLASILQFTTPYPQSHVPLCIVESTESLYGRCVSSWRIVPALAESDLKIHRRQKIPENPRQLIVPPKTMSTMQSFYHDCMNQLVMIYRNRTHSSEVTLAKMLSSAHVVRS